jgi:hypothetical protein
METLAMIRQAFREESPYSLRLVKSKNKSMLIIFFDFKGIVHKEFVLAGQTVNSAYHCNVLWGLRENVRRLCPELWQQKKWLMHHDNTPSHTSNFSRELLTKKQHDCHHRITGGAEHLHST